MSHQGMTIAQSNPIVVLLVFRGQLLLCDDCEYKRERIESNSEADNTWLRSANWGEM